MTTSVNDTIEPGVFFSPGGELPRGRHSRPPSEILDQQRERLMAAFTELLAARGYTAVRVIDIATRAGVSLSAFYKAFNDKEACAFAGYDRFIDILVARVSAGFSGGGDWREQTLGALRGYLGALQSDLVVARAYQLEMDSASPRAREHRREALHAFARVLEAAQVELVADDPILAKQPFEVQLGIV